MDTSVAVGILGIYLTIISLLLIYEVLRLQIWVEAVDNIYDEVKANPGQYMGAGNREKRRIRKQECNDLAKKHPSFISYLILSFITLLSGLGIYLSYLIRESVCIWFTAIPVGALFVIILLANVILIKSRRNKLHEIESRLEAWAE